MLYVLARATEASDLQKHCDKINCTTGMLCWYSKKSKTTRTGRKTKKEGGRRWILGFGHLEKCQEAQSLHHWRCNIYLRALEHVSLHTHMHTVYQKQHRQVKDSFSDLHRDTYSPSHRHTHTHKPVISLDTRCLSLQWTSVTSAGLKKMHFCVRTDTDINFSHNI